MRSGVRGIESEWKRKGSFGRGIMMVRRRYAVGCFGLVDMAASSTEIDSKVLAEEPSDFLKGRDAVHARFRSLGEPKLTHHQHLVAHCTWDSPTIGWAVPKTGRIDPHHVLSHVGPKTTELVASGEGDEDRLMQAWDRMWSTILTTTELQALSGRAAHGTHARYNAHLLEDQVPCDRCREGEARYLKGTQTSDRA